MKNLDDTIALMVVQSEDEFKSQERKKNSLNAFLLLEVLQDKGYSPNLNFDSEYSDRWRCMICANPGSWEREKFFAKTPEEAIQKAIKYLGTSNATK